MRSESCLGNQYFFVSLERQKLISTTQNILTNIMQNILIVTMVRLPLGGGSPESPSGIYGSAGASERWRGHRSVCTIRTEPDVI